MNFRTAKSFKFVRCKFLGEAHFLSLLDLHPFPQLASWFSSNMKWLVSTYFTSIAILSYFWRSHAGTLDFYCFYSVVIRAIRVQETAASPLFALSAPFSNRTHEEAHRPRIRRPSTLTARATSANSRVVEFLHENLEEETLSAFGTIHARRSNWVTLARDWDEWKFYQCQPKQIDGRRCMKGWLGPSETFNGQYYCPHTCCPTVGKVSQTGHY